MKPSNLRSTISKSATRVVAVIGSLTAVLTVAAVASAQDSEGASSADESSSTSNDEAQAPSPPPEAPAPASSAAPQEEPTAPNPPKSQAPPTARFPDAAPKRTTTQPHRKPQATNPAPTKPAGRQLESKPATQKSQQERAVTKSSATAQRPSRDQEDTELAANPQRQPTNKDKASDDDDSSGGLFGPIRLGPMVGVGLPNLLSFGGLLKLTRYLGGGINIGLIPTVRVKYYGQATLLYQEYDIYGRLFPFGGGFFLGAGVGYEVVKGTMSDSMDTFDIFEFIAAGIVDPKPAHVPKCRQRQDDGANAPNWLPLHDGHRI